MKQERIGEIFVRADLLSPADLSHVLTENRTRPNEKFGETVVRLGLADETQLARALSFQLKVPYIDLDAVVVDPSAVKQIPRDIAEQQHLLPVYLEKTALVVAMDDPQDFEAIEAARFASGLRIHPHIADAGKLSAAITRYYSVEESLEDILRNVEAADPVEMIMERQMSPEKINDLKAQGEAPATVKLFNTLILQALSLRATSIYLEAREQEAAINNTVDGRLLESMRVPKWTQGALISRIKMMAGLDITQRYERQDGILSFKMPQRLIDLQVSCIPSRYGEHALLKFLETGSQRPRLSELNVSADSQKEIRRLLSPSKGLVLACGPYGSGKTMLLYAMACELVQQSRKVVSVESPIEQTLEGMQQVQVNEHSGLSYARAGASLLKHHPDAMLVGDLRDRESVEIVINAALEDTLLLSAIRSENLISAIRRLLGFGVSPDLIASALSGIISQRIVRKPCEHCRERRPLGRAVRETLHSVLGEDAPSASFHAPGCELCHYTGYQGQAAVYHVFPLSRSLHNFIRQGAPEGKLQETFAKAEQTFLLKQLLSLVEQGSTTLEEIERVLPFRKGFERSEKRSFHQAQPPFPQDASSHDTMENSEQTLSVIGAEQVRNIEQIAVPQKSENAEYAFQGRKILLVDDDLEMSKRVKFILEEKHFAVSVAQNGEEALTLIRREKPHLVVTDIMMPVMNGLELIRRLRKDVTTTFIPVIILSSKHDTADRLKGFAVGTDDYLPKPFSTHELFFRINAILRRVYR